MPCNSRMKALAFAAAAFVLASSSAAPAGDEVPLSLWRMPLVWPRHIQLRNQLIAAIRANDAGAMERTCRDALKIIPGDATWHYNLACALARKGNSDGKALNELAKAIDFGFHDAAGIAADKDFKNIRDLPRFAELVGRARSLKGKPGAGRPEPATAVVRPGGKFTLEEANLGWNFDLGVYEANMKTGDPERPLAPQATDFGKSKPTAPERPYVVAWISEGTSSGNTGDIYENRDGGHSMLATGDFPGIATVEHHPEAKAAGTATDHPLTIYPDCAVFGNVSRARVGDAFWRSLGRASMTDANIAARMNLMYLCNQFWVMPAHKDYGHENIGDVFPGAAPFQFITVGSSWSDQPALRAALAASASFLRPTKEAIVKRILIGPTMQWLLRRTRKGVETEDDYLSPKAHPTAFDAASLDTVRLVETAHALRPEQIPPVALLNMINSKANPIRHPVPGRDFPDAVGEVLYATSSAICIVLRASEGVRTFMFHARSVGASTPSTFAWRVVHGDASAVKIAETGDLPDTTPERGFAKITIDRRGITNRIDVACFAKAEGTSWGAPSFISFFPIPQEKRVYRPDGKIASIDYSNPDNVYSDPLVALPRHWKDTYSYDASGKLLGWTRSANGAEVASFTPDGLRIVERRADGTPSKLARVKYVPRPSNDKLEPLTLTYMDDGEPFEVK